MQLQLPFFSGSRFRMHLQLSKFENLTIHFMQLQFWSLLRLNLAEAFGGE